MTQPTEQIGLDPVAGISALRIYISVVHADLIHAEVLREDTPLTMQVAGFRHAG